jgi:hypothetical protein
LASSAQNFAHEDYRWPTKWCAPLGLSEKTLRNHKSNAKSALLWLANERGVPRYGIKPTPEWAHLLNGIKTNLVRWRIYAFARFCSANNISPEEVTEEIVDQFATYRETIGKPLDPASRRLLAKAWNSAAKTVPGWPQTQLGEPPRKSIITVPWEQFPPGLRADIDQYLESLTRVRRNAKGRRIRPLRPSTRRARFAELQAAARMAAENGCQSRSSLPWPRFLSRMSPELSSRRTGSRTENTRKISPSIWGRDLRQSRWRPNALTTTIAVRLAISATRWRSTDVPG